MHGDAPRSGIVVGAVADVKDFAHRLGAVAVAHEKLRERDGVGVGVAEVAAELVEAGGGGARAEEQRETGGGADGLVAIRGVEAQAAPDEAVEIRRDGGAVAVSAERGLQVVDEEEEDVGARGRGGGGECRCNEEQEEGEGLHVGGAGRGSEGEPGAERVARGRVDGGAEELAVGVATDEGVVFLLEEIGGVELELDAGAAEPLG